MKQRAWPVRPADICIACFSARFAWLNKFALTLTLPAARSQSDRSLSILPRKFLAIFGIAKCSCWARAKPANGRCARWCRAALPISNRSPERAEALALAVNGRSIAFEQWAEQCAEIDILITSTSSDVPLLSQEKLAPILRDRIDRPLFIIDIAVPRDVAPDVNALDGVYLYDIDSLQSIAEQSLATRRAQIAAAEQIISEHVAEFDKLIAQGLNCSAQTPEPPAVGESSLRTSES